MRKSSEMISPMIPTIIRITPTVASSMPETDVVTANFRMAPSAMRKMEVPIPMGKESPAPAGVKPAGSIRSGGVDERHLRGSAGSVGLPRHDPPDRHGAHRAPRRRD